MLTTIPKDLATLKPNEIIKISNEKGQEFKDIKTNQIRNIYAKINSIRTNFKMKKEYDEDIERSLILLKPKLAYAKGRKREVGKFQEFMFICIDAVVNSQNKTLATENFLSLIESVVAFHKFYGGD